VGSEDREDRRSIWAWALYDWANSAFATVVIAGFFPLLFNDYWAADLAPAESTLRLGWASAVGALLVALSAPVLGAIADGAGAKRRFLAIFMIAGALATAMLAWVPQGSWLAAAALYVCASAGFMGANVFYDALLVSVARPGRWHAVSGLGFGLGYLGGGLLYAGCVFAALSPATFGFASAGEAARYAFVATAAWWLLFSLPLFLFVREPPPNAAGSSGLLHGFSQVAATLRQLRRPEYRTVALFLLAYWLYIDGVDTLIQMAVKYGRSLGFGTEPMILALLLVQFIAFPAAIAYGYLGERFGPKRGIYLALAVYVGIALWGTRISETWEFYGIAVLVGLVQGGVQALSRSYFARLIPPGKSGEFFGFYNLLGKSAALIGPPLFGLFGVWFGNERYSMLALVILFVGGGLVLSLVDERKAAGVGAVGDAGRAP
jgi:UMF1 family MFS transporter